MLLLSFCLLLNTVYWTEGETSEFVDELISRVGYTDTDYKNFVRLLNLQNAAARKDKIDPLTGKPPEASPIPKKLKTHVNEIKENSMLLYEGDITLSRRQISLMTRQYEKTNDSVKVDDAKPSASVGRKLTSDLSLRWTLPINYNFDTSSGVDSSAIAKAIDVWRSLTCLTFQQNNNPSSRTNYIQFFKGGGCYSSIGSVGGKQTISIGDGCEYLGITAHEIGHALGLWHEQSRPDRDDYVEIVDANIQAGTLGNFQKLSFSDVTLYDIPYDLGSVMHYAPTSFSKNSGLTIQTKDPNFKSTPGQREQLSFYDVKFINLAYCDKICPSKLPCQRNGYTDPKDCTKCRCPDGLGGQYCEKALQTSSTCGSINLVATSNWQTLSANDIASCNWLITNGGSGQKIQLRVQTFNLYCQQPTCTTYFVEFRYGTDIADTGARLCCQNSPGTLTTATEEALILYRGAFRNSFSLQYKLDDSGVPQTFPPTQATTTRVSTSRTTTRVPVTTTEKPTTITRPQPITVPWVTRTTTTEIPWWLTTEAPWRTRSTTKRPRTTTDPWWFRQTTEPRRTRFPEVTVPWWTQRPGRPYRTDYPDQIEGNSATPPTSLGYSEWSEWSQCSDPCGGCGVSTRTRVCFDNSCSEKSETETKQCGFGICYGKCADPLNLPDSTIIPRSKRQCGYCCQGYVPNNRLQQCVRKSVQTVADIVRGALDSVLTPLQRAA